MKTIFRLLLTSIAVVAIANFLPGVEVTNFTNAIYVAIVLGLLRISVKPLLIVLTLPASIITFGLFLFVINAIIIMLAGYFVSGFTVNGFWIAFLFSILLSMFQSVLYSFLGENKENS